MIMPELPFVPLDEYLRTTYPDGDRGALNSAYEQSES